MPSNSDRSRMPYTKAVILEIMRCGNIIPLGAPHSTPEPLKVNGITIPAYTMVNTLMAEILKGDHWEDGMAFNPDRFLSKDGSLVKDEHIMFFGSGKRQCPGETLAKTEMFLFFTGKIQYLIFTIITWGSRKKSFF